MLLLRVVATCAVLVGSCGAAALLWCAVLGGRRRESAAHSAEHGNDEDEELLSTESNLSDFDVNEGKLVSAFLQLWLGSRGDCVELLCNREEHRNGQSSDLPWEGGLREFACLGGGQFHLLVKN
jgi:hypothetical protein